MILGDLSPNPALAVATTLTTDNNYLNVDCSGVSTPAATATATVTDNIDHEGEFYGFDILGDLIISPRPQLLNNEIFIEKETIFD